MNNSCSVAHSKHINLRRVKELLLDQGERGWNVSDLARAIGHSPPAIHNILSGRRPYSKRIVPKIAKQLGVKEEDILVGVSSPKKAKRITRQRRLSPETGAAAPSLAASTQE